jgi:DNA polymerase III epsilon subunit-like protein
MTLAMQGDWTTAPLIALDLEGSGAQDHEDEAILEIAVVPITAGQPDISAVYSTLINPGRTIPRRPWISPGLTTAVLAAAPGPAEIEAELARRVNGHAVVGHNVGVDWRLLHRRYPAIAPAALIDTLRLARRLNLDSKNSLSALTAHLGSPRRRSETSVTFYSQTARTPDNPKRTSLSPGETRWPAVVTSNCPVTAAVISAFLRSAASCEKRVAAPRKSASCVWR